MSNKFKLRPEITDIKYWLHIPVIAIVVLGILQLWLDGDMFNVKNIIFGSGLIALGDIIAHTLLRID